MNELDKIVKQLDIDAKSQPPVDLWRPKHHGEIDIRIDGNGFWYHEGDRILRDKLVRLFASILWFEGDQYFLVTPVEKLRIQVVDVPYLIHQAQRIDGSWLVTTNTHEQVIIGDDHPVRLQSYKSQDLPYVHIRYDLWARINRSVYFQWVEEAMDSAKQDSSKLGLVSGSYEIELASA